MTDYQRERDTLLALRRLTRPLVLGHYRQVAVEQKADGSDVTEADRATERLIRTELQAAFPGDGWLGEEEGGSERPQEGRCWVVDPIDGTTWYALGVPFFATLVALLEDGEPVLGLVDLPGTGESYFGAAGLGAWWLPDGAAAQPVRARPPRPLAAAFGSASGLHGSAWAAAATEPPLVDLGRYCRALARFRCCGDALQHMLVARGQLDLALDVRMAPWDSAALVPVIEQAGGAVCALDGRRPGVVFGGSLLSASHPELLAAALEQLRPAAS